MVLIPSVMAEQTGVLELQEPPLGDHHGGAPLQCFTKVSSETGLSSVTTLIVGSEAAVIVDPPLLVPDAKAVIEFVKEKTQVPVVGVFVSHLHPDHYMSANPILEAWPESKFYAHQYVRAAIDREYDAKIDYWPKVSDQEELELKLSTSLTSQVFGRENIPEKPRRPEVYPYSFFMLPGDPSSPIVLLGPVQGDSVDHTLFWLPQERVIITGDAVYARSTHAWVEEVETPELLHAWRLTLLLIEGLNPERIIGGHIEEGWEFDAKLDMQHMHRVR